MQSSLFPPYVPPTPIFVDFCHHQQKNQCPEGKIFQVVLRQLTGHTTTIKTCRCSATSLKALASHGTYHFENSRIVIMLEGRGMSPELDVRSLLANKESITFQIAEKFNPLKDSQ